MIYDDEYNIWFRAGRQQTGIDPHVRILPKPVVIPTPLPPRPPPQLIIPIHDRLTRRSGEDYAEGWANLLPVGIAWPREYQSVLMQVVRGLAEIWGFADSRAADLLEQESDPRKTLELLPDWERAWGLPDPCYQAPQTIGERQYALVMRMTILGAQSREFYIDVADKIGYTITISEYRPFVCGLDRCGDNRVYGGVPPSYNEWGQPVNNPRGVPVKQGELSEWPNYGLCGWYEPPDEFWFQVGEGGGQTGIDPLLRLEYPDQPTGVTIRYYWTVHVDAKKLVWFRVGGGGGQTGVDPHLRIGLADDLECLLNRWKPAHTKIIFDYSTPPPPVDELIWFRCSVHQCGIDPHLHVIPAEES